MSSYSNTSQILVFSEILNENLGKTLFIEYLENNNLFLEPFEVLKKTSNNRVDVKRIYNNTTTFKDLSVISNIGIYSDDITQNLVDATINVDQLLQEPAYQMILSGTDEYTAFHEKKFLSCDGCRVPIESIYLSIKLGYNNYEDVLTADVSDLKTRWTALINDHKNKAVEVLTAEKTICQNDGNTDDVDEIDVILTLLDDLTDEIDEDVAALTDRDSVLSYWPPLLLPAPSYLFAK